MSKEKQNTPTNTPTQNQFTNSELKQIEKMAEIIHKADVNNDNNTIYFPLPMGECLHKHGARRTNASIALYHEGYRKQEQGVWIFEHEFYGKMLCSNCKEEALVNECNEYVDSDFCPNCGAKMKGGAE